MKALKIVLFGLGLLLVLINVFGLLKSMRHPDLYTEENTGRLNDVVSKSMSHYFKNEGKKKYNLRVPLRENYILFFVNSFKKDDHCCERCIA